MRRAAQYVVSLLPLCARDRRAMDETLADWANEARLASTLPVYVLAQLRGIGAVALALAFVSIAEARQPSAFRTVGAAMTLAAVIGALRVIGPGKRAIPDVPVLESAVLVSLLSLNAAAVWMIPLLAVLPVRQKRALPYFGVATVGLAIATAFAGWIVPVANQQYRERAFAHYTAVSGDVPRGRPARGAAELTLGELILEARRSGVEGRSARSALNTRLGVIAAVPLFCFLGAQARRFTQAVRRPRLAPLVAAACVVLTWMLGLVAAGFARALFGASIIGWAIAAACLALALILAHASARSSSCLSS